VLGLLIYFCVTASAGLHAYFTLDDGGNIMTMHRCWERSPNEVVLSVLQVITPAYRPMGGLYYFLLYKFAGFHPMPFRAVCLALMFANIMLALILLRRLSGSLAAAAVGATLITNHPAVLELLYSSGTIYEILCFLFYALTLLCYFAWRKSGRAAGKVGLSWPRIAVIVALTGAALDSKEMAMTIPAALLLVELIYFPPQSRSWQGVRKFVLHQGRAALATAALVAPTMAVKVLTRNPLSDDPRYRGHSVAAAIESMRAYHHFLFYGPPSPDGFSALRLFLVWVGMALAAVILRSRQMIFGLCFVIVTLIPVCLIGPRGGYMTYIPLIGWALYFGMLFQRLYGILYRGLPLALPMKAAALILLALLIANTNAEALAPYAAHFRQHERELRRVVEGLRKAHPDLPHGAAVLLVDDPLDSSYELALLAQFAYRDPTLVLDKLRMLPAAPAGAELTHYDFVLAGGWDLHDVRGISDMRAPVQVEFGPGPEHSPSSFRVAIRELRGQTVDLTLRARTAVNSRRATAVERCKLDLEGGPVVSVRPEFRHTTIDARWVRTDGGSWMAASGSLEVR
jgi:hypothetical protein